MYKMDVNKKERESPLKALKALSPLKK